ncbi:hypothetical protein [Undibacterium sp. Ren11W]|uniref:hypothetical protein n=1 Tax=Undibacterium sp. Ren11W TaxID=3413045 RepID=UPI003BEF64ED
MARSTKASNAVLRLNQRSAQAAYSMVSTSDGHFYLVLANGEESVVKLNEPLEIDAFVSFVNSVSKQAPKKASKFDLAFEEKLQRSGKKPE